MSILSDFEDRLSRGVEGLFAGAFRSPVQPAELAKALARMMDDRRSVGVGKVYAPTDYMVALSAEDHEQLGDFAATLAGELSTFLVGYASEQGYELTAKPRIGFTVHDDLKLGRFRVSAKMSAPRAEEPAQPAPTPSPTPERPTPAPVPSSPVHALATVTVSDLHHDIALKGERIEVGRLAECDIAVADANVSRVHAAFVRTHDGWVIQDLDSTNGTFVNGTRIDRAPLHDGDTVQVGATQLVYHEPKG